MQQAGKYDKAERLLHEAQEENRKTDDTFRRRQAQANAAGWLARNFHLQKRYTEAEPLAREAVAYFETYQPNTPRYFYWMSQLGVVLAGRAKYAEAEPLLLQSYEGMNQRAFKLAMFDFRHMAEAGERIIWFYETTHQPEKARMWRKKLESK